MRLRKFPLVESPTDAALRDFFARVAVSHKAHVSNSYLSELKKGLCGLPIWWGDESHLKFGIELHHRDLQPHLDFTLLSAEEEKMLWVMCKALDNCTAWQKRKKASEKEQMFIQPVHGTPVKVILDLWDRKGHEEGDDLKSTSAKSEAEFLRSARKYDYFRQAWLYMQACKLKRFTLWGVQKTLIDPKIFPLPVLDYKHDLEEGKEQAIMLIEAHNTLKVLLYENIPLRRAA